MVYFGTALNTPESVADTSSPSYDDFKKACGRIFERMPRDAREQELYNVEIIAKEYFGQNKSEAKRLRREVRDTPWLK